MSQSLKVVESPNLNVKINKDRCKCLWYVDIKVPYGFYDNLNSLWRNRGLKLRLFQTANLYKSMTDGIPYINSLSYNSPATTTMWYSCLVWSIRFLSNCQCVTHFHYIVVCCPYNFVFTLKLLFISMKKAWTSSTAYIDS